MRSIANDELSTHRHVTNGGFLRAEDDARQRRRIRAAQNRRVGKVDCEKVRLPSHRELTGLHPERPRTSGAGYVKQPPSQAIRLTRPWIEHATPKTDEPQVGFQLASFLEEIHLSLAVGAQAQLH